MHDGSLTVKNNKNSHHKLINVVSLSLHTGHLLQD